MTSAATPTPVTPATMTRPQASRRRRGDFLIPTAQFYIWLGVGMVIPVLTSLLPDIATPPSAPVADFWEYILRWFLLRWRLLLGITLMGLYDVVLLGILIWDFGRSRQWVLQMSRSCEGRLSIGRQNLIHLYFQATAHPPGIPATSIQLWEHAPQPFAADQETFEFAYQANTDVHLTYHVFPPKRGKFSWTGLDVRLKSPLGWVWRGWFEALTTEVEVYPDLIGLRSLSVRLSLEASGSLRRRRHALGGTEFAELRDYNLGDDLRLMDWKATARRGRPLVRVMEPERDQPLIILLDRGRLMTAQVAGLKRFDWALNAALALALTGLRRGDRVGLAIFDRKLHTWVAPQSGDSHLGHIISQVYNCEPVLEESDYIGTVSTLLGQYTRRALVVMLTEIIDEVASNELLAAMTRLSPRFLPFCVAFRDRQIEVLAHEPLQRRALAKVDQVQHLYEQAIAVDLLKQRHLAFARIKQQGVLVLDAPADCLSEQLVDRYLLLKARGRL